MWQNSIFTALITYFNSNLDIIFKQDFCWLNKIKIFLECMFVLRNNKLLKLNCISLFMFSAHQTHSAFEGRMWWTLPRTRRLAKKNNTKINKEFILKKKFSEEFDNGYSNSPLINFDPGTRFMSDCCTASVGRLFGKEIIKKMNSQLGDIQVVTQWSSLCHFCSTGL